MKLLFLSNLFPDAAEPGRGVYNARLVRWLGELCEIRVVSPRAAWPFWPVAARHARAEDARFVPQFPPGWYLPKLGSRVNPWLMAQSLRCTVAELKRKWAFDAALVSWVYPDACAVARLAAEVQFPFVAVAQGSDVHQYLGLPARRAQIVKALNQAGGVVARSGELTRLLREAGVATEKTRVIYNGVDTAVFQPGDKLAARRRLGLSEAAAVVLFVGNLLPIKNPLLALEAFGILRGQRSAKLVLLGDGPLRADLLAAAQRADMVDDVLLPGRKAEPEVALYLRAADVLCVASRNEGMPNVILEALASGLPVVATRVGGIPEILEGNPAGRLVPPADGARMASALAETLAQRLPPETIATSVRKYSWTAAAGAYFELLQALTRGGRQA